ncbi:MAG: anti-sigma factor [Sphingomonadales bacterium]|nr:anti-sigma factor [Sphingomonadales bacterium]
MTISREQVAAFADGELVGEEARAVAAAVAADPALLAEVEAHRALRARLAAHFAPVMQAPVPDRLRDAALQDRSAEVIDFAAAAARGFPPRGWRVALPALAASLVLAFLGFNAWQDRHYAQGPLAGALDQQLAATAPAAAPVRVLLSFRDGEGQFCRAFSASDRSGIACRDERGWRLHDLQAADPRQASTYRQAGSSDAAIMAAAQAMAAGPALDAAAEAAAARRHWRR